MRCALVLLAAGMVFVSGCVSVPSTAPPQAVDQHEAAAAASPSPLSTVQMSAPPGTTHLVRTGPKLREKHHVRAAAEPRQRVLPPARRELPPPQASAAAPLSRPPARSRRTAPSSPRVERYRPAESGAVYDPAVVCGWAQSSGMDATVVGACHSQLGRR